MTQLTAQRKPIAQDAIDAIARFGGNQNAAAESLGLTRGQMAGLISSDIQASSKLNAMLRTLTILDTAQTLDDASVALRGILAELDPKDLVSLVSKLTDMQERLTSTAPDPASLANGPTTQINFLTGMINQLPPEIRAAVAALTAAPKTPEHTPIESIDGAFEELDPRQYIPAPPLDYPREVRSPYEAPYP